MTGGLFPRLEAHSKLPCAEQPVELSGLQHSTTEETTCDETVSLADPQALQADLLSLTQGAIPLQRSRCEDLTEYVQPLAGDVLRSGLPLPLPCTARSG